MTNKNRTLWLVRHGETIFNVESKLQGMSDSPLTELGMQQINKLADRFRPEPLDYIFCSDLLRAKTTADIIASRHQKLSPIVIPELRERSFGIYEGQLFQQYRDFTAERHYDLDFSVPNGESLSAVCNRAEQALNTILSYEFENVLVVAHGSFNRCFLAVASQAESTDWLTFKQTNCCVNKLTAAQAGKFRIDILNCSNHLDFS